MPTLLLTRPEEDAGDLANALRDIGVDSVIAPLLRIENIPGPALELDGVQGFLLTSANGARALAARTAQRNLPVHAVGDATARAARDLGFETVSSAGGDVDDLARLVLAHCRPDAGDLLHAAGSVVAGDLAALLAAGGFEIRREMLYESTPVTALPAVAESALRDDTLDGVVLYSPRTARAFDQLVTAAGLGESLKRLRLFALSDNVDRASRTAWGARSVAGHPDQQALLDIVRACYY